MKTKEKGREQQQTFAPRFRLGVYDSADDDSPVRYYDRIFNGSPGDRETMENAIREFNRLAAKRPRETRCIAVFPLET